MYFSAKPSAKFINFMMEFKKSEDKLKQRINKVCNKPNLYSSRIKLMKLVYTTLNVSFLETLVTHLSFSRNIFTSRKESDPFISVSIENFMFLCFLFIYSRKNCACSGLLNIIHISFVINRFEIFRGIFQPITFVITKKNISQCRS